MAKERHRERERKGETLNHLWIHQQIRSAIGASHQLTSPIVCHLWNFRHRLVRYYWYHHRKFQYWNTETETNDFWVNHFKKALFSCWSSGSSTCRAFLAKGCGRQPLFLNWCRMALYSLRHGRIRCCQLGVPLLDKWCSLDTTEGLNRRAKHINTVAGCSWKFGMLWSTSVQPS